MLYYITVNISVLELSKLLPEHLYRSGRDIIQTSHIAPSASTEYSSLGIQSSPSAGQILHAWTSDIKSIHLLGDARILYLWPYMCVLKNRGLFSKGTLNAWILRENKGKRMGSTYVWTVEVHMVSHRCGVLVRLAVFCPGLLLFKRLNICLHFRFSIVWHYGWLLSFWTSSPVLEPIIDICFRNLAMLCEFPGYIFDLLPAWSRIALFENLLKDLKLRWFRCPPLPRPYLVDSRWQ